MVMRTRQLWHAMRYPERSHPIFLSAYKHQVSQTNVPVTWKITQLVAVIIVLASVFLFPFSTFDIAVGIVVGLPLLMIAFNATLFGMYWVNTVSSVIAISLRDNRFELMSLSPKGALGVGWLLCVGALHRHNFLNQVHRIMNWVVRLVSILLILAIGMLLFGTLTSESQVLQQQQLNVVRDVINICLIIFALWIDHIQSVVLAGLIGMSLPKMADYHVQWRLIAPIIYLMIQSGTYILVLLFYSLLSNMSEWLFEPIFMIPLIVSIMTLGLFYLLRNMLIESLWQVVLRLYSDGLNNNQQVTSI